MRPTLYEFAGGAEAFAPFAAALHARCLADPELNHPFSHPGQNPRHVERLGAYWAQVMGGPWRTYTGDAGAGMSPSRPTCMPGERGHERPRPPLRRLFHAAADDAGRPADPEFRAALRAYMERAVDDVALSHPTTPTSPPA